MGSNFGSSVSVSVSGFAGAACLDLGSTSVVSAVMDDPLSRSIPSVGKELCDCSGMLTVSNAPPPEPSLIILPPSTTVTDLPPRWAVSCVGDALLPLAPGMVMKVLVLGLAPAARSADPVDGRAYVDPLGCGRPLSRCSASVSPERLASSVCCSLSMKDRNSFKSMKPS